MRFMTNQKCTFCSQTAKMRWKKTHLISFLDIHIMISFEDWWGLNTFNIYEPKNKLYNHWMKIWGLWTSYVLYWIVKIQSKLFSLLVGGLCTRMSFVEGQILNTWDLSVVGLTLGAWIAYYKNFNHTNWYKTKCKY